MSYESLALLNIIRGVCGVILVAKETSVTVLTPESWKDDGFDVVMRYHIKKLRDRNEFPISVYIAPLGLLSQTDPIPDGTFFNHPSVFLLAEIDGPDDHIDIHGDLVRYTLNDVHFMGDSNSLKRAALTKLKASMLHTRLWEVDNPFLDRNTYYCTTEHDQRLRYYFSTPEMIKGWNRATVWQSVYMRTVFWLPELQRFLCECDPAGAPITNPTSEPDEF